ncbi:WD40-repeat-containing domain protein [Lactarius akahatsu]|uniref:WD40-repeat-containing domain protein n=1 Tax=Lactarius akahatsu TaxID=416441 RepID=A0AAD4LM46_9AGAM|nr:WD40-repeat-containing domain protein [Lactarius akahatsu]
MSQTASSKMFLMGIPKEFYSIDFSRDGRLIISSPGDRTTCIWDVQEGSNRVLAEGDTETTDWVVSSVAFSSDWRLVAGSLDNTVRIWDVATGQLIGCLGGHKDSIYGVVFTSNGNGIVSGSLDKMLKFWDVGKLLANATNGDPRTGLPPPVDRSGSSSEVKKVGDEVCTMSFLGHKTSSSVWRFRTMASGSYLVRRIAVCISKTLVQRSSSLCSRVTNIQVSAFFVSYS